MSRILLGVICGLVFGAIDIGIMLPMSFPDKRAAITAAFIAPVWNWICNRRSTVALARLGGRTLLRPTTEHP